MHPVGGFLNPSNRVLRHLVSYPETASCSTDRARFRRSRFSFPLDTRCIGLTDGWIAINCHDTENKHKHTYLLHNEFSGTTLPLLELDADIGHVSEIFEIRKVLMRSTPDDVIAVMTNHRRCPIILTRLGKGVWLPKSHAAPLTFIIDFAFLGDRLYGITRDEDLVFLDIASDDNGVPMVTGGECVIAEDFYVWIDDEDDNDDNGDNGGGDDEDAEADDDIDADADDGHRNYSKDDDGSNCEDEYENDDNDDDDYNDEREDDDGHIYDLMKMTSDDRTLNAIKYMDGDECQHGIKPIINTMWYLIESSGKLLMVRRQVQKADMDLEFTWRVEVFEADMSAAKWVPIERGLGGLVLFISRRFSKSISAACSKEIQEDAIYFIDTDDVFDMTSQTVSAPRNDWVYVMTLRSCDRGANLGFSSGASGLVT